MHLKKSWSQMIQNCLIRREMAKKKIRRQTAIFGGSGGTAAGSSVFRVDQFNSEKLKKKLDRYHHKCACYGVPKFFNKK